MWKKMKLVAVGAVAIVLGGFLRGGVASAVAPTLIVTPMNQEVILTPGEVYEGLIKVANAVDATENLKYAISVGSFSQSSGEGGDSGMIDVEKATARNEIMDWITVDKKTGEVAPNETEVVNFTIKVPKDAPAGGQYATILVENVVEKKDSNENSGGVMIESIAQVASVIYAQVAGETSREGAILENKVPSFLINNTLEATSLIENRGNIHTNAEVALEVWSVFGGDNVCAGEEGAAETTLVLPDTKRFYKEVCKLPMIGFYNFRQTVKIFGEESMIEGVIVYCPIWTMVMLAVGVIMVIIWLVMTIKIRKKQAQSAQ